MQFSTSNDLHHSSPWLGERSSSIIGRGEVQCEYGEGSAYSDNERAKAFERVRHRQRQKHVLIASDARWSGRRAERWNAIWDKGVKETRLNILEAFIYLHKDSNAATMETDLGSAASLFFTRLTSWLRLSYKTFRSGESGGKRGGRRAASPPVETTGDRLRSQQPVLGMCRKPSEVLLSRSFSTTRKSSMRGLSNSSTHVCRHPPIPANLSSRTNEEQGLNQGDRIRRHESRGRAEGRASIGQTSAGTHRHPSHSASLARDSTPLNGLSLNTRFSAADGRGGKGRGTAQKDGGPRWGSSGGNTNATGSTTGKNAGENLTVERDGDESSRSALLLLLQAIIIFVRGLSFMTQFVESGVGSMLTDCLECGTQSYPLVEGAPLVPSPFHLLTKSERKHVVLLLLYLANTGRVYRELICDETGLVKLFHALQRERDEDIGILLTELFTSLGHGHPRMAPAIHSGLIRVILFHCQVRGKRSVSPAGTAGGVGAVVSNGSFPVFLSFSTTLASSTASKEVGEKVGEEMQEGSGTSFPGFSLTGKTPTHRRGVVDPSAQAVVHPDGNSGLPLIISEGRGKRVEEKEKKKDSYHPWNADSTIPVSLPFPTGTAITLSNGTNLANRISPQRERGGPICSHGLQKEETDLSSYLHHYHHHYYPYCSPEAMELLERTVSDQITFHTARTLHYLQITREEQHFALCQSGRAGFPGAGGISMDLVPIVGLSLPVGVSANDAPPIEWERPETHGGGPGSSWRASRTSTCMEGGLHGREEDGKAGEKKGVSRHQASSLHPHFAELHFTEFLDALMYLTLHENTRFRVEGSELLALAAKNLKLTRPILTRCFEILDNDMLSIADEDDKARIARRQRLQLSCGRAAVQIILSKPMSEERKTLIIHYVALRGAHLSILKYLRLSDSSDAAAVHDCCKALQLIARASHAQQRAELQQMQHSSHWMHSGDDDDGDDGEEDHEKQEGSHSSPASAAKISTVSSIGGTLSPILQMGFVIHDTIGDHLYQVLLHEELSEEESFAILRAAKSRKLTIPTQQTIDTPSS